MLLGLTTELSMILNILKTVSIQLKEKTFFIWKYLKIALFVSVIIPIIPIP